MEYFNPYEEVNKCSKRPNYPEDVHFNTGYETLFCGGILGSHYYSSNKCFGLEHVPGYGYQWLQRSDLVYGRRYATSIYLSNTSFIVLGGRTENPDHSKTEKSSEIMMNPMSPDEHFVLSDNLPEEMSLHCMARINNTHLFIAGDSSDGTAYIVNTDKEHYVFTELPRMNYYHSSAACGTTTNPGSSEDGKEDQLFIVAGGNPPGGNIRTEIFSTKTNAWKNGPLLPREFGQGGYFSDEEHPLIMVGGKYKSDVMAYEKYENLFTYLPGKLNIARSDFAIGGIYTDEQC